MELKEPHEVVWGKGYELYYVDDESTGPVYVGHFGYDNAKPDAYLDCVVTGVECVDGKLEVTTNNPIREQE